MNRYRKRFNGLLRAHSILAEYYKFLDNNPLHTSRESFLLKADPRQWVILAFNWEQSPWYTSQTAYNAHAAWMAIDRDWQQEVEFLRKRE